jgi:hypothetical protein
MESLKKLFDPSNRKQLFSVLIVLFLLVAIPLTVFAILKIRELRSKAAGANITIDYTSVKRAVSPIQFSMDESHYGGSRVITNDQTQRDNIKKLKIAMMRVDLAYKTPGDPNSGLVCYAAGCNQSIPGIDWVNTVRASGAEPEIKVRISNTMPSQYWASDAANEVTYFNKTAGFTPVRRWIIGNEPDNNSIDATTYSNGFVSMYNAMKAVDPTIKIGGPANAWYNTGFITTFLTILKSKGITPDFVDYHSYGTGGTDSKTDAQLLANTVNYENNANNIRSLLVNTFGAVVGNQIDIEMGEWNLSWSSDPRTLQHLNTVWSASALGHMVNAGMISRQYADKNGSLGALCESSPQTSGSVTYTCNIADPTPIYHGIGMFTGESLFPSFGTSLVSSTTTLANVEVYASDNPKNIVVINKDPAATQAATIGLNGVSSGTVDVWQKGPADKVPTKQTSLTVSSGSFSYNLAPYTVYTFLVTPGGTPSPLTVSVTSPANGSTVSGNVSFMAAASSTAGAIAKVEFYVDGSLKSTSTNNPYSYTWDSTTTTNGQHTISAKAYDSAGNSASSSGVSVNVSNGSAGSTYLWIEAENSTISSPMSAQTDSTASGGKYINSMVSNTTNVPPTNTGTATIAVSVPVSGLYTFWTRVNYSGEPQNSFFAQFDGGTLYKVGNEKAGYNTWKWIDWYNGDASTSNIIKVTLTAGNHILKIIGREANTKIDKFLLTNDTSYTPSGLGSAANAGSPLPNTYLWFESEKGTLASPMVTGSDSQASGSTYVYTPTNTGSDTITINVPSSDIYTFWARVNYSGEFQNSFFAQFDGGTSYKVGNENTGYNIWKWVDWQEGQNGTSNIIKINLSAGTHTLKITGREPNTKIDKFLLTTDPKYTPTGQGS